MIAARGRADGRTLVFVPEVKGSETTGITLLHVRWVDRLPAAAARGVLDGYGRYGALVDAVTETEPTFRDDLLGVDRRRRSAHRADPAPGRPLALVTAS